jgi:hypothetical protein
MVVRYMGFPSYVPKDRRLAVTGKSMTLGSGVAMRCKLGLQDNDGQKE